MSSRAEMGFVRSYDERMSALAESFPTLVSDWDNERRCMTPLAGVRPWDPVLLDSHRGGGHGQRCAIQFVLSVWNPSTSRAKLRRDGWKHGSFDLQEALQVWDKQHRGAFLAWASNPWWP